MSNIYIQEPPTNGKVLLETTVGDIDIELWSKEAPKACRNFVQLCMEGYFNNTIFHRLVKDFIVQGGDPKGDGTGGNSIWGKPFKDEFHSRLRWNRRGLIGMANSGRDDNASQFFFTLGPTPELQNKNTLFAKVSGNTIYNMLKLGEGDVDEHDRPLYPYKILKTKILSDPFGDIEPREIIQKEKVKKDKNSAVATKNFKLLSFGAEAEEDEEEVDEMSKKFNAKGKSSHDLLTNDPKLSSMSSSTSPINETELEIKLKTQNPDDIPTSSGETISKISEIRSKLKKHDDVRKKPLLSHDSHQVAEGNYLGKSDKEEKKRKLEEIKAEVKKLKQEMKKSKDDSIITESKDEKKESEGSKLSESNEVIAQFLNVQKEYKEKRVVEKGASRESATLALLAKFQNKIQSAKEKYGEESVEEYKNEEDDVDDSADNSWLARKLEFNKNAPILAKDASLKSDDWFEIHDPRNPLTKRRREAKANAEKNLRHKNN